MPMKQNNEFAAYCCDLLSGVGPCVARRMFGGYGISTDGLTIALMTDLGQGEKLWLKASDQSKAQFLAAGGQQFLYVMKGKNGVERKGMNYFTAPEEAMESTALMLPWARLALQAALVASAAKLAKTANPKQVAKPVPKPAKPIKVAAVARAKSGTVSSPASAASKTPVSRR